MSALAVLCAALAAAVLVLRGDARLPARLLGRSPPPVPSVDREPRRERLLRLGAASAGVVVWLLVDGSAGAVAGVASAVLLARWLPGLESAAARRRRDTAARDAPVAMRLLAVCLDAGTSLDRSCDVVADALGGPLADDLRRLGTAVRLGVVPAAAGPPTAWDTVQHLVLRSATSGIAVSTALDVAAGEARAAAAAASEAAARRAGVLVVLPLGVCFLPAFVLLGVAPLVYGIVRELLAGW